MTSLMNKYWTDTSVLPSNILSLQNYDFFKIVENLAGDIVADLLRIQSIRNVRTFMIIPDVLAVFKIDSLEIEQIKNRACFRLENDDYVVKIGIELSLRYLRDLFAIKIHEYYNPNNDNTDENNVPIGQKRSASSSSEPISNKRGRK
jgi:hypothetical protein